MLQQSHRNISRQENTLSSEVHSLPSNGYAEAGVAFYTFVEPLSLVGAALPGGYAPFAIYRLVNANGNHLFTGNLQELKGAQTTCHYNLVEGSPFF